MRSKGAGLAAIFASLYLSGCSPQEATFFNWGVGTDLYAASVLPSAKLEDLYIGLLCDQAGLPTIWVGDAPSCAALGPISSNWTLIVQAGMNDIDRRCDEYLTWLDNRKRSQAPVMKELSDLSVASQAIMTIAGTGANAIGIVGVAFGLAANTFTNINSRLLYEVNHSTIQSIVLSNNNRFRQDLQGKIINNRPAAIYALRSYLRICMPYTIETQINNAVTLFEVGGVASADADLNPLISATNVATATTPIRSPRMALPPVQRPIPPKGSLNKVEDRFSSEMLSKLQKSICVTPQTGQWDSNTRDAIVSLLEGNGTPRAEIKTTGLTERDVLILRKAENETKGDCARAGFRSPKEIGDAIRGTLGQDD